MQRARRPGNEHCPVIRSYHPRDADSTRTTALQMHTRQWVDTYAGRGNGDYREELASALQAITTY